MARHHFMSDEMEKAIFKLVETAFYKSNIRIGNYQKIELRLYDELALTKLLDQCKFTDIGSVYNYPESLPQPQTVDMWDLMVDQKKFHRICLSEKMQAILYYSAVYGGVSCTLIIDIEKLKKFSKVIKPIIEGDSRQGLFQGVDFRCGKYEFIEVAAAEDSSSKPADVIRKKVEPDEGLVFDVDSTLHSVMVDIQLFFQPDTKQLHKKLKIGYKLGMILYGTPGNGKSATIREIIRRIPNVSKVVLNTNVNAPTKVLSALIKTIKTPTIVIIEDIDSVITHRNRSEFLNILDGVDVVNGLFFIGTTNYPEKIDPAFMNRAGRFDRTYRIDNPSEETRRIFYTSRDVNEMFAGMQIYEDASQEVTFTSIVELFVKYSEGLPMASLKEVLRSAKYATIANRNKSLEEILKGVYGQLTADRKEHQEKHSSYLQSKTMIPSRMDDGSSQQLKEMQFKSSNTTSPDSCSISDALDYALNDDDDDDDDDDE